MCQRLTGLAREVTPHIGENRRPLPTIRGVFSAGGSPGRPALPDLDISAFANFYLFEGMGGNSRYAVNRAPAALEFRN
jgi:hypothetical protein